MSRNQIMRVRSRRRRQDAPYENHISLEEAEALRDKWKEAYPEVFKSIVDMKTTASQPKELSQGNKDQRAIHYALRYMNEYNPQDKSVTDFAADHSMTTAEAEEIIDHGTKLLT